MQYLGALLALLATLVAPISPAAARDDSVPHRATPQALDWSVHEGGLVHTLVTNWGQIGSSFGSSTPYANEPSAQWPGASGVEYLWTAGFWFGAMQDDAPHVTTAAYPIEFHPGTAAANLIYATHAGAPGGNRAPAPADDDFDGQLDEDWLDGRDNDGDSLIDEDFAGIADEMFVSTYGDTDPSIVTRYPDHVPLGLEVRQTSLAWSRPEIDDFVGYELHVTNVGSTTLTDFHVGLFADCDIGARDGMSVGSDDRAGFWEGDVTATLEGDVRDVPVSIAYMVDDDHDGGATPGFIGFVFLGPTPVRLRNFRMWSGGLPYDFGGDPTTDPQRLACLKGTSPSSLPPPDGPPRTSQFAGTSTDWRIFASIGPLPTLAPGAALDVTVAMVLGASLEDLLQNAARAQMLYDGVSADCDGNPGTPEECVVHWTTPLTVPVGLEHLAAYRAPDAVHVEWRLGPAAQRQILGLRVLRGAAESGPFAACADVLLAPTDTHFADRSAPGGAVWYRLGMLLADGTTYDTRAVPVAAMPPGETWLDSPRLAATDVLIRWSLSESSPMRLTIHDVNGRLVRTLERGQPPIGLHTTTWNRTTDRGDRVSRGVYLVRLESATKVLVRKVALLTD